MARRSTTCIHGALKAILPMLSKAVGAGIVALFVTLVGQRAFAADHYVCDCGGEAAAGCSPGDDGANGATAASAWRTIDKAADYWNTAMPGGDRILLCRGGSFPQALTVTWQNPRCNAAARCSVAPYDAPGTSGRPAPILFWFHVPGPARGYSLQGVHIKAINKNVKAGILADNEVMDIDLNAVEVDLFDYGVDARGSSGRWRIENSFLHENRDAISIRGQLEVVGSRFVNNTSTNVFLGEGAAGSRVARNEFAVAGNVESCVTANQPIAGLTVEDNVFRGDPTSAANGVVVTNVSGLVVRRNRFLNMRKSAAVLSATSNCLVENNLFAADDALDWFGVPGPAVDVGQSGDVSQCIIRNNSVVMSRRGSGFGMATSAAVQLVGNAVFLGDDAGTCFLEYSKFSQKSDYNVCNRKWSNAPWADAGNEGHSIAADLAFRSTSAGSWDLHAAASSSPIVDHGPPVGDGGSAAVDIFDNARSNTPDIGAYEFGNPEGPLDAGIDSSTTNPDLLSDAGDGEGTHLTDGGTSGARSDGSDGSGGCELPTCSRRSAVARCSGVDPGAGTRIFHSPTSAPQITLSVTFDV
jgi:hypothetical protein